MSGFVAIVTLTDAPLDEAELAMPRGARASDADHAITVRPGPGVALIQAFSGPHASAAGVPELRTSSGSTWVVAHARLDARAELREELSAKGLLVEADAPDALLVQRAYEAWQERCVEHLLGDFAFALWDAPRKTLFCARDALGVRPLFYARTRAKVVVSSRLDWALAHGAVADELDEAAIADFLLFGIGQEPTATCFRGVRRLAAGHRVSFSARGAEETPARYWSMPIDGPLSYRRAEDYTDRFRELLRLAVRDRLRDESAAAVLMSGGLDSTALAAVAFDELRAAGRGSRLTAITSVYERRSVDPERRYAELAARHIGIPILFDVRDDEPSVLDWPTSTVRSPEPVESPSRLAASIAFYRRYSSQARVFLYGEGPDNALRYEWRPYLRWLVGSGDWTRLARDLGRHVWFHRRIPLLPTLPAMLRERLERSAGIELPAWLAPELVERLDLRERLRARLQPLTSLHPLRPQAEASFRLPQWQALFDDCDLNGTEARIELRHPFLDLRVLRFMLSVPAIPWCRSKLLLRRAMRGALPPELLRREKATWPAADRSHARLVLPRPPASPELSRFIDLSRVPLAFENGVASDADLRPWALAYWLERRR